LANFGKHAIRKLNERQVIKKTNEFLANATKLLKQKKD